MTIKCWKSVKICEKEMDYLKYKYVNFCLKEEKKSTVYYSNIENENVDNSPERKRAPKS